MVRDEHRQSDRVKAEPPQEDFWKDLAHRFTPTRSEEAQDDTLDALLAIVRPQDTVIDVGAGAGRLAIPLARHCRQVTAVEPSQSMRDGLAAAAQEWGIENLRVIPEKWEDARTHTANVSICAHVLYTVTAVEPFVRKLHRSSKDTVAVILFDQPAMSNYFPLWKIVHQEERLRLPCLGEFRDVLAELGIEFSEKRLPRQAPAAFQDRRTAMSECMARLFIQPGSPKADRLDAALDDSLVESNRGLAFPWAKPHTPWLITWNPQTAVSS